MERYTQVDHPCLSHSNNFSFLYTSSYSNTVHASIQTHPPQKVTTSLDICKPEKDRLAQLVRAWC
ncbi:uncharacterized protein RSE6_13623 [Rhynchosporium secalis]|uniref:Uncharacterized protein n=1 Tax=Rhynchosporium secalis TaxID=38038 RepID=A0A1E1MTA0_RHYSE|nr:uncharacterized protein RSE6_13623 [Rhynchosporium secalis]